MPGYDSVGYVLNPSVGGTVTRCGLDDPGAYPDSYTKGIFLKCHSLNSAGNCGPWYSFCNILIK